MCSFHLKEEIEATDMTAKEAVMSVDVERAKLEAEAEELNDILLDENCDDHDEVMDRLTQVEDRTPPFFSDRVVLIRLYGVMSGLRKAGGNGCVLGGDESLKDPGGPRLHAREAAEEDQGVQRRLEDAHRAGEGAVPAAHAPPPGE